MQIEAFKKLIKKAAPAHARFVREAAIADRYYAGDTDYIIQPPRKETDGSVLRSSDVRVTESFLSLLVQQKAGYVIGTPPTFDAGSDAKNNQIREALGHDYERRALQLVTDASLHGTAWVHYWRDDADGFHWAVVPGQQVLPIFSDDLESVLIGAVRVYTDTEEETGRTFERWEYWTDNTCYSYAADLGDIALDTLMPYPAFESPRGMEAELHHDLGAVPFIEFKNNADGASDLQPIKRLIDIHDQVLSGFVNDLADIQEVILILSGYSGTDLNGLWSDIKKYKVLKIDDGDGGASTLNVEIPVEARRELLTIARKAIFESGQGLDPHPEQFGDASGVALQFMYALLELKASHLETEFRSGFSRLAAAILRDPKPVRQIWTRTAIRNDSEQAQICAQSVGIVSKRTILAHHPLVDDVDTEIEQLKTEAEEDAAVYDWRREETE